ncbi:MAG: hypothetical protein ACLQE9_12420 [Roseiarcus sp.]
MDELVTQMGLMLTQLRYARRALEDIERSTSRYAGFAFAGAMQAGAAATAPPMLDGALKVYVVNINDLAPGSSFGGFLESLLGGVGKFFGGLLGGFVGGTVSGFNLPAMIIAMNKLADRVERILLLLGIVGKKDGDKGDAKDKKDDPGDKTFLAQLDSIRAIVDSLGKLIGYGNQPEIAGATASAKPEEAARWLDVIRTIDVMVKDVSRVVDGLIILIPTLIGALASVIVHLKDIQVAILDLLRFLFKEILMLRGVLLFTLYDTIAGAAHLAADVMKILGGALGTIIVAIGGIFATVFDAGLAVLKFVATGLKSTVDTLVKWLLDTVGVVLMALGDSRVFRVIVHVVQILPALLPSLVMLVTKGEKQAPNLDALQKAADLKLEGPMYDGKKLSDSIKDQIPEFPDLSTKFAPPADLAKLTDKVGGAFVKVGADLKTSFDTSVDALNKIGAALDDVKKDTKFLDGLKERETKLNDASQTLQKALIDAEKALNATSPSSSGLDKIAQAYEEWLSAKGMDTILTALESHFATGGKAAPYAPPAAAAAAPISVEIKELVIDLGAQPADAKAGGPHAANDDHEFEDEHDQDGFSRAQEWRDRHAYPPPGLPHVLS